MNKKCTHYGLSQLLFVPNILNEGLMSITANLGACDTEAESTYHEMNNTVARMSIGRSSHKGKGYTCCNMGHKNRISIYLTQSRL